MKSTCTIEDLHWQAGMFEGEGSIRINKPTYRNLGALLVDMANTELEIVEHFRSEWGGTVKRYEPGGNRKPYYRWRAASKMAEAFLMAMWPCLLTNKYQARAVLGLDFQAQKTRSPECRTDAYRDRQWEFYERMKALNQRGTGPR